MRPHPTRSRRELWPPNSPAPHIIRRKHRGGHPVADVRPAYPLADRGGDAAHFAARGEGQPMCVQPRPEIRIDEVHADRLGVDQHCASPGGGTGCATYSSTSGPPVAVISTLLVMGCFREPIPESTFRRGRATGRQKPRGERNENPATAGRGSTAQERRQITRVTAQITRVKTSDGRCQFTPRGGHACYVRWPATTSSGSLDYQRGEVSEHDRQNLRPVAPAAISPMGAPARRAVAARLRAVRHFLACPQRQHEQEPPDVLSPHQARRHGRGAG